MNRLKYYLRICLALFIAVSPVAQCATTTTLKPGSSTTVTITIASLANGSYRQSNVIDNSSANNLEYIVTLKTKANSASTSSAGTVSVYVCASFDGSTYEGGCNGTGDASFTPTMTHPNLHFIGLLNLDTNSAQDQISLSVAGAFNGIAPVKFQIVILNQSGNTLDATAGNSSLTYVAYALQNN